jgi:hypothetical protein
MMIWAESKCRREDHLPTLLGRGSAIRAYQLEFELESMPEMEHSSPNDPATELDK